MPWICPKCNAEIEELRYSVPITDVEYGTACLPDHGDVDDECEIIDHEYSDSSGSNWDGDPEYECQECDHTIDLSEIKWKNNIEDDEETIKKEKAEILEETTHTIIRPIKNIMNPEPPKTTNNSICCKNCRHIMVLNGDIYGEIFCECPICNEVNSTTEYISLVHSGFYNKEKNDNSRKHRK